MHSLVQIVCMLFLQNEATKMTGLSDHDYSAEKKGGEKMLTMEFLGIENTLLNKSQVGTDHSFP